MTRVFRKTTLILLIGVTIVGSALAGEKKCAATATQCEIKIQEMLKGTRYLGVTFYDADRGILVKTVMPESPAELAGLKSGDRVMAVNETDCSYMRISRFKEIMTKAKESDRVTFLIKRRTDFFRVKVRLSEITSKQIKHVVAAHLKEAHTGALSH